MLEDVKVEVGEETAHIDHSRRSSTKMISYTPAYICAFQQRSLHHRKSIRRSVAYRDTLR